MQRQQKFLGNVNVFRQPKLFWIMSHVTYLIACSAFEITPDQRVTECIPMMTRRKHIHDARWIKVHLFGSGPYRLNRISKLQELRLQSESPLEAKKMLKKAFTNSYLVFVGVWSIWGDLTVFHCREPALEQSLRSQFTKGLPMNYFPDTKRCPCFWKWEWFWDGWKK